MTILKLLLLLLMLLTSQFLLLVLLLWTMVLSETDNVEATVVTDDNKSFVVGTFAALVVDVALVDEATVIVPHCNLVVVLELDAVVAYGVDVLDPHIVVAVHLTVYLVVVAVLNPNGGIEVHVDVALLVFPVLQELSTKLVHLTDQL